MKKLLIAAMTLATLFVVAPQPASAFPGGSFLITCKFVTFGTFDPLTGMASHEHTFAGNLGVQINSTKQQLLTQSTNCSDSRDHPAYWIPTFTKNGTKLQPYQVNVYYVGRGVNRVAFPDGYVVKSSDVRYACSNDSSGKKVPSTVRRRDGAVQRHVLQRPVPRGAHDVQVQRATASSGRRRRRT